MGIITKGEQIMISHYLLAEQSKSKRREKNRRRINIKKGPVVTSRGSSPASVEPNLFSLPMPHDHVSSHVEVQP